MHSNHLSIPLRPAPSGCDWSLTTVGRLMRLADPAQTSRALFDVDMDHVPGRSHWLANEQDVWGQEFSGVPGQPFMSDQGWRGAHREPWRLRAERAALGAAEVYSLEVAADRASACCGDTPSIASAATPPARKTLETTCRPTQV